MSIFSVGVSGLNAAQAGILTASHNISNASTPGFSRQETVQGTNIPMLTGSGFQGQGTHVVTVKRIYDEFLGRQVLSAEASASEMDSYLAQIKQIDNLLADPNAGLSPALAAFFKGVQDVAANPASIPSRQSMLSAAQSLVARFQSIDQRMTEIRDGTNSQIMGQVTAINTYSAQIADINQRIILAQAGNQTQAPNDLLDQRDQMLKDLNKLIRVSTLTQGDGSFNVFIGNGQPLVVGTQSYQLQAVASRDDPERIVVAMKGVGGTTLTLPDSQITGGTLGGLVAFRSQSLDAAQNAMGRLALSLAQNFNDQHHLGMDLTGALGVDFFNLSNAVPTVRANGGNSGSTLVTGMPTVTIDSQNIDELTVSDYTLTTDGTNFTLTRLSDNVTTAITTVPQLVDGMSINTSTWTSLVAGDKFLIQPTRVGARNIAVGFSDARMIAAAAPVRTSAALANTGTASINSGTVVAPPPPNPALQNKVTITFTSATTYDVLDVTTATTLATGVVYPDPLPATGGVVTYNGWTAQITGNPATGDVFTVETNANGVADNRNAMLLGALQTAATMLGSASGPTASYQSAYSQIVSEVGSKTNEVTSIGASQQSLVDHATESLQQLAGVNLDEEAANLLRYQQAYQASAKIFEIASKIFDEIIALGR
ncbi:flagellar hook-associated protein FlgK [Sulfuritalea hydrogenivorans]|uniref:Flagellar hook-associated protein 1 n=1 Tax=Sulfuritalea hydrogenivorans sk43H TaxID=1223802 RepID=W0SG90_9PROT|nr:flagellar hook-associated protein FlgK [Sulfuritalea hydrogenivorans]BAO28733.1 flagellar hook-associated protein FlgK [Sulfuritalea hydrogenivorans sk43H]